MCSRGTGTDSFLEKLCCEEWRSGAVARENEGQRHKGDYKMRVGGVKACSPTVENDPGGKKPLLTLERGKTTEELGREARPPRSPSGGTRLWQELGCFPSNREKGRRSRGPRTKVWGLRCTHFQKHTYPCLHSCPLQSPPGHLPCFAAWISGPPTDWHGMCHH